MLDDLFVPDPAVGDSSNRIPNTRWVTVALASAVASVGLPSIGGLNLLANSSTGTAVPTGLSASNYLDSALGSTQGALLYRNAATWVVLAAGTNGQILQTQGAGANPQWVGGKVLLTTLSPNGVATIGDVTSFTNAYRSYEITFNNLVPASAALLQMQVATTGTSFISANYLSMGAEFVNGTTGFYNSVTLIGLTEFAISTAAAYGYSGSLRISNPAGTTTRKEIVGSGGYIDNAALTTSALAISNFFGFWDGGNNAITGVQFKMSSGNIATGVIQIWGLF